MGRERLLNTIFIPALDMNDFNPSAVEHHKNQQNENKEIPHLIFIPNALRGWRAFERRIALPWPLKVCKAVFAHFLYVMDDRSYVYQL